MSAKTRKSTAAAASPAAASPLSPTRLSRMQEKLELQNLNDRLAAYIDRVRFLETENSRLTVQMHTTQETVSREVSDIKSMYERELGEARRALDDTAKEKARLQIDAAKWKSQLDDTQHKLLKREKDLSVTEKKLANVEGHNQELQARTNQLLSEKKKLEDHLKNLEHEAESITAHLESTKQQLEEEALYRVDLLNKIQSVKEELSFKETIHEKELSESRVMKQTDISDIDLNLKEHYEQRLADTLKELRDQYETQMRINRDEIETIYEAKIADLRSMLEHNASSAQARGEELRSFKSRYEQMSSKVSELESQNEALRNRIRDLETVLEQEREWHHVSMQAKEEELRSLRDDMEKQLREYEELLGIKVALDMEIAAYRKLLEVEEDRLRITPMKSPEGRSSTPVRRTPIRGTKRKRTVLQSTGEQSSSDSQVTSSAKSDIEVHEHDAEGKYIKLYNKGNTDIPLGGWQLIRKAGDQETVYKFHRALVIKANSYITVWSMDSGVFHNPPSDIVMKSQKWFTSDSMSSVLLNNNGEEMAIRETSKRVHRSSEQRTFESGPYFTSQFASEDIYHQQGTVDNPQERCCIM